MEAALPVVIQPLVETYLQGLEPLRAHFYGIYITDSVALGAFEERASDIDVIALTQGEWSSSELKQLEGLHKQLVKSNPLGRRLEVCYIPLRYLGVTRSGLPNEAIDPYPVMHDGRFLSASSGGLNAVTWWIIKHHGVCLWGSERSALSLEIDWDDVLATMRFNLDVYFARKVQHPSIYLSNGAVEFAVSNLCRILTTIEEGEIIAKSTSLTRWRERLPVRWQRLLDEAWRLRHRTGRASLYRHRWQRMNEMLAFIHYVRERGRQALDAAQVVGQKMD